MIIINIYSHIFPIYVFLQYSVAADAIWPDFSPSQKLDTHSSVFIAKAYAILATIKYIVGWNINKSVVFSNSFSVLQTSHTVKLCNVALNDLEQCFL